MAATAVAVLVLAAGVTAGVRPLLVPEPGAVAAVAPTNAPSPVPPATTQPRAPVVKQPARQQQRRRPPAPRRTPRAAVVTPAPQEPEAMPVAANLRPFAGLSTWIDIYDTDLSPAEQVERAAAGGVQVLFVQSARHKSPTDIQDPARLGQVLELAHDRGLLVMVWYVPDLVRERRDFRRSQAAIAFASPRGDRPDAFGLDIEIEDEPDIALRTERLLRLSAELRAWVGKDYPMAAIVLPPLQLELRQDWWPDFPYAELRPYYDVFIPMSYSSYRGTDAATTYRWNVENVQQIRAEVGDPTLPVHLAGGIADNFPEVGAFTKAVFDSDSIGGGLYDLHTTHPDAWAILARLRTQR
jgi:hypothetical protein